MAFPADRTFLIGSVLDWWDKQTAKRDAKRSARRESRTAHARAALASKSK